MTVEIGGSQLGPRERFPNYNYLKAAVVNGLGNVKLDEDLPPARTFRDIMDDTGHPPQRDPNTHILHVRKGRLDSVNGRLLPLEVQIYHNAEAQYASVKVTITQKEYNDVVRPMLEHGITLR